MSGQAKVQESDCRLPECVLERVGHQSGQWHAVKGEGSDTFQPILCDDQEGVNMPGNRIRRQPTCTHCYAMWRRADQLRKEGTDA